MEQCAPEPKSYWLGFVFCAVLSIKFAVYDAWISLPDFYLAGFIYNCLSSTIALYVIFSIFRWNVFIVSVCYIFGLVLFAVTFEYFSYCHRPFHIAVLLFQFREASSAAVNHELIFRSEGLLFLIDVPVFLILIKNLNSNQKRRKWCGSSALIPLCGILILVAGTVGAWCLGKGLLSPSITDKQVVSIHGWTGYWGVGLVKHLFPMPIPSPGPECRAQTYENKISKPNFIMLQVESLDSNVVNWSYNGKKIMPFLSEFSKKNAYFPRMISQHLGGGSSDAEWASLTSMPADRVYALLQHARIDSTEVLPGILKSQGYSVNAYHGNSGGFYRRKQSYVRMGFDTFFDHDDLRLPTVGWGAPDADLFNAFLRRYSSEGEPRFDYIITLTSHEPFRWVEKIDIDLPDFKGAGSPESIRYLRSMTYVDRCLREFISRVDLRNTYVFMYGDHTPWVPMDRASTIKENEFHDCSVENLGVLIECVPLIIAGPNVLSSRRDVIVSMTDIMPTVIGLTNASVRYKSQGIDLLNDSKGEVDITICGKTMTRKYVGAIVRSLYPFN